MAATGRSMRVVGRPRFPTIRRDEHPWRATAVLGMAASSAAVLFAGAAIASQVVMALGVLGMFSLFFGVILRPRWKRVFGAPIVRRVDEIGPAHIVTDGRTIRRDDIRGAWRVTRGDGRTYSRSSSTAARSSSRGSRPSVRTKRCARSASPIRSSRRSSRRGRRIGRFVTSR